MNLQGGAAQAISEPREPVRLRVSHVSKSFVGTRALTDVSFDLRVGEVLALVGENGAGKSTLIKILSGAHAPDSGEILVGDTLLRHHSPIESSQLGIATVYQEMSLFPDLSVAENLAFEGKAGFERINWSRLYQQARETLADLGLTLDVRRLVRELSVAEKQMVEIAKALHRKAEVLILDEPTAVLGGQDVDRLVEFVRRLKARGVSVVFISHRLEEVFDVADTYLVLKDGAATGYGPVSETSHDRLVSMMVGRDWVRPERRASVRSAEPVLKVRQLTRGKAVRDVSFDLFAGEVIGIAGLRGAGRTELARAIFGADRVDSGTVEVAGSAGVLASPVASIRAGVGLVPEERKEEGLLVNLSTMANIPLARYMKLRRFWSSPKDERRLALHYKNALNIRVSDVGAPVATLSGGNQQKVVLAKWLDAGVKILILDEPTRGIDIGAKQEIYGEIQSLCENGLGVIVISSELPEILSLSDRILVMHQGAIHAELDARETTEEEIMAYAVGAFQ